MNITDLVPEYFPSRYQLALALKLRPAAVYQWKDGKVPPLRAYQVLELLARRQKPEDQHGTA
jgi:DNA-binding transcriptional regulator Cro